MKKIKSPLFLSKKKYLHIGIYMIALILPCCVIFTAYYSPQDTIAEPSVKTYNGIDISEHVTLTMYYVGDIYGDEDMIFNAINEIMEEEINATIEFNSISLSDYQSNYSLLLKHGYPIDLIYTSGWCYYTEEAAKGAFYEITDEMIAAYMPETAKTQSVGSINKGKIDGKLYYVPCDNIGYVHNIVLIRGDLREKYGLGELKSLDDLHTYMSAVVSDPDADVSYAYNASLNANKVEALVCITCNNFITIGGTNNNFVYQYSEDITADDILFLYETDEFREFAHTMREWYSEGLWSVNPINNRTNVKSSFLNGTSAVFIGNLGICGNVKSIVNKNNPEYKPEIYDINQDKVIYKAYECDGYAVPYTSNNPERALMALDIMKNNKEVYTIARYGIEDYHITLNDDRTWSQIENDNAKSYDTSLSWGLKNSRMEMEQKNTFADQIILAKTYSEISVDNPTGSFKFSTSNVIDHWTALEEVWNTYIPTLQLGLADDVDGWLNSFLLNAEACNINEIKEDLARQLNEYLAKNK